MVEGAGGQAYGSDASGWMEIAYLLTHYDTSASQPCGTSGRRPKERYDDFVGPKAMFCKASDHLGLEDLELEGNYLVWKSAFTDKSWCVQHGT